MSVKFALLALLEAAPRHGYQLRTEFEESTGNTWPLNVGQVYTTLTRLERDGLVAAAAEGEDEAQRPFALTPAGRAELDAWYASPVASEPARSELAIKLALATRLRSPEQIAAIVQVQRAATISSLRDFTQARERAGEDLAWLLVADRLIFAAEAEVRWLDHCEASLTRAARQGGGRHQPTGTPVNTAKPTNTRSQARA